MLCLICADLVVWMIQDLVNGEEAHVPLAKLIALLSTFIIACAFSPLSRTSHTSFCCAVLAVTLRFGRQSLWSPLSELWLQSCAGDRLLLQHTLRFIAGRWTDISTRELEFLWPRSLFLMQIWSTWPWL